MRNFILVLFLSIIFNSCKKKEITAPEILEEKVNIDGYWVLTNYIDKILETKSIKPQIEQKLTWEAIVLKISKDSIETHGLIMRDKQKLSNDTDSLTTISGMGNYKFNYIQNLDIIKAVDLKQNDTVSYTYRKIKKREKRLIKNIDNNYFYKGLESNFYSFIIDSLIVGSYKTIGNPSKMLNLSMNGQTSGFKKYNDYSIHDYFGTLHPFEGDAIIFRDTTLVHKIDKPTNNLGIYNWSFNKDTLVLIEMKTKNFEEYYIGQKTLKFLRVKKNTTNNTYK
jgi:hypothetical protein